MPIGTGAAIVGIGGATLSPWERAFLRDFDPFGLILFARNIENPGQLRALTGDIRAALGRDAPILIDQEGGRVQRMRAPHWREWTPPLGYIAAMGDAAAQAMALRMTLICAELRSLGIDANCAPVADIAGPMTHPFLQNRCYGTSAAAVTHIAHSVATAHLAAGVLPVLKHLPGHGRATADSHMDLPRVTAPLAELIAQDFAPFAALRDLPMAMTAHIVFDAIDPARPATQSPDCIAVIRQTIGFGGLLMTDDLGMQALSGAMGARAALSLAAGCDLALYCKGEAADLLQVAPAAPAMTPATQTRARLALAARSPSGPAAAEVDIAAVEADLAALEKARGYEPTA